MANVAVISATVPACPPQADKPAGRDLFRYAT